MEDHDVDILARTIWGEARGEPTAGEIAVGWTARNRAAIAAAYEATHGKAHQHFGDGSIASACQMRAQYSCWNQGDPNRAALISVSEDSSASFRDCVKEAQQIIAGSLPDPTHGSCHYYSTDLPDPPAWAIGHTPVAHIGKHLFFNDIPA